jgi:hypothetical protein
MSMCREIQSTAGCPSGERKDDTLNQARPLVVALQVRVLVQDDRLERLVAHRGRQLRGDNDGGATESDGAGAGDIVRHAEFRGSSRPPRRLPARQACDAIGIKR